MNQQKCSLDPVFQRAASICALSVAFLAKGTSIIEIPFADNDVDTLISTHLALGARVVRGQNGIIIEGVEGKPNTPRGILNCNRSSVTFDLALGYAAVADGTTVITGEDAVKKRMVGPIVHAFEEVGAILQFGGDMMQPPVVCFGGDLRGGRCTVHGDGRMIATLMLTAPMAKTATQIESITEVENDYWIWEAANSMQQAGIIVTVSENTRLVRIEPGVYNPMRTGFASCI